MTPVKCGCGYEGSNLNIVKKMKVAQTVSVRVKMQETLFSGTEYKVTDEEIVNPGEISYQICCPDCGNVLDIFDNRSILEAQQQSPFLKRCIAEVLLLQSQGKMI